MASKSLGGVVNDRLQVYGLANVRVVDAGIIPLTIGAPLSQTVYTIAEQAAVLIAADLKYHSPPGSSGSSVIPALSLQKAFDSLLH